MMRLNANQKLLRKHLKHPKKPSCSRYINARHRKKIDDINFQFQEELEEDIGKKMNDLQEQYPNFNLVEKYL
jgi:hypothetical protein